MFLCCLDFEEASQALCFLLFFCHSTNWSRLLSSWWLWVGCSAVGDSGKSLCFPLFPFLLQRQVRVIGHFVDIILGIYIFSFHPLKLLRTPIDLTIYICLLSLNLTALSHSRCNLTRIWPILLRLFRTWTTLSKHLKCCCSIRHFLFALWLRVWISYAWAIIIAYTDWEIADWYICVIEVFLLLCINLLNDLIILFIFIWVWIIHKLITKQFLLRFL